MFRPYHSNNKREFSKKEVAIHPVKQSTSILNLAKQLPSSISLGCAGWNFLGWKGLVWDSDEKLDVLNIKAINAYSKHPLFKAPSEIADCIIRDAKGRFKLLNPNFLNIRMAMHDFIYPAINGLGEKCGPLIFQLAPIPKPLLPTQKECYEYIDRITQFFTDLPKVVEGETPIYGLEIRTLSIYTKRLLNQLRNTGVRLVVGIHPSMPNVERQASALRYFEDPETEGDDWQMEGPLIVRWTLNPCQKNGVGKMAYSPYNQIVHPDDQTRLGIAKLIAKADNTNQPSFTIVNNKAEGCAPLSVINLAKQIIYELKKS